MTERATALVTGVSGQDGVYLARHLLDEGLEVVGTIRPGMRATDPLLVYLAGVHVVEHDVRDDTGFAELLQLHHPTEVYNLASFSSVGASWGQPELVAEVNGAAVVRMLDRLVAHRDRTGEDVRFFQASSAEELGDAAASPYARAKAVARAAVDRARQAHGLFACAALLHNHESPLRGRGFVTRKITRAAAAISLGLSHEVTLGNLSISRDWGHAADYVRAMRLLLAAETPHDVPLGTGVAHTLGELLETAFATAGLGSAEPYVRQDPALVRPVDAEVLVADPAPARDLLGWEAETDFSTLVAEMVEVDLRRLRTGIEEASDYLSDLR